MHVAHANVTVSALKSCQKSRILRILEVARAMSHLVHRLGDWHVPDDFFPACRQVRPRAVPTHADILKF